jgi:hypothetical protein
VFVIFSACDVFKCTLFVVVNFVLLVEFIRQIEIGHACFKLVFCVIAGTYPHIMFMSTLYSTFTCCNPLKTRPSKTKT